MFASDLKDRVSFEKTVDLGQDKYGSTDYRWEEQFKKSAHILYNSGDEMVIAARLSSVNKVVISVRKSSDALSVDAGWRIIGHDETAFNIRSIMPSKDRRFIEFICESGVATG